MKFWFIEDGKKRGPMEDYELRELIVKKEITFETKVWHEGADDWQKAIDVPVLTSEFKVVEPPPLPVETPAFLPWRRLAARWFDLTLYQLCLALVFKLAGISFFRIGSEDPSLFRFLMPFFPLLIVESILLHQVGTTPGKFLLNLHVTDRDGERLSLGAAVMRSFRVWVLGMGMQFLPLTLIAHGVAMWFGRKRGAPLWDFVPGHLVRGGDLPGARLAVFVAIFFGVFLLLGGILGPEAEAFMEKFLEEMNQR